MKNKESTAEIYFEETQRFNQWWLWALLLFIFADLIRDIVMTLLHLNTLHVGEALGDLLLPLIPLTILLFVKMARLKTKITDDGVCVRFYPLHRAYKLYEWKDIKRVYIRDYAPIGEYGGWGFRGLFAGNRAYNTSGDIGLQLIFVNDNRLLIGTQKKEELRNALLQMQQTKFDATASL